MKSHVKRHFQSFFSSHQNPAVVILSMTYAMERGYFSSTILSLWIKQFLKRTRRNQLFLQNHRTLSKSKNFLTHLNESSHLPEMARLIRLLECLPSLGHFAHSTPASSPVRTVLRDQTIQGYSLFCVVSRQKFYNSSSVSLNFPGLQTLVLQTTPNRSQFPGLWS